MKKLLKKMHGGCTLSLIILKLKGCVKEPLKKNPWQLKDVPNHFKTGKMCEKVVEKKQKP